jgi:hypothetical protein
LIVASFRLIWIHPTSAPSQSHSPIGVTLNPVFPQEFDETGDFYWITVKELELVVSNYQRRKASLNLKFEIFGVPNCKINGGPIEINFGDEQELLSLSPLTPVLRVDNSFELPAESSRRIELVSGGNSCQLSGADNREAFFRISNLQLLELK